MANVQHMSTENQPVSTLREETDSSLRIEREKVDDALGSTEVDAIADAVLTKARARADEVLAAARAATNHRAAQTTVSPEAVTAVKRERAAADQIVEAERDQADESARRKRLGQDDLLAGEREQTDVAMSRERDRADGMVTTRNDLLGIVSHDLRNMLVVVMSHASLIAIEESHDNHKERVLSHVEAIDRAGARMTRLLGDLLDIASIEAGKLAVTREMGDPAEVVKEAVDAFRAHAAARGISLVTDIAQGSLRTEFDATRIFQVLVNLISNAIRFTPPAGRVTVRLAREADEIRLAVSDTGIGIASDNLQSVFGRFLQLKKHDAGGIGLGLYISKSIVLAHGGRIWAESKEGAGSTFYFTLPTPLR